MITAHTTTTEFAAADDTITLDETDRHRRRMKMVSDGGIEFLLDLEAAKLLRSGEGLVLSDGRIIAVKAAQEDLYIVQATSAKHLLQLAWQIGNRHLPAQIASDHILIRKDHVIREMLEGLGATIAEVRTEFNPEGGAYGDRHSHQHSHSNHHHHKGGAHA